MPHSLEHKRPRNSVLKIKYPFPFQFRLFILKLRFRDIFTKIFLTTQTLVKTECIRITIVCTEVNVAVKKKEILVLQYTL